MPNILQKLKEDHIEFYSVVLDSGSMRIDTNKWIKVQSMLPPDVRHKCFSPQLFTLVAKDLVQFDVQHVYLLNHMVKLVISYQYSKYIHSTAGSFIRDSKISLLESLEFPGVIHSIQSPSHVFGSETTTTIFGSVTIEKSEAADIYFSARDELFALGLPGGISTNLTTKNIII